MGEIPQVGILCVRCFINRVFYYFPKQTTKTLTKRWVDMGGVTATDRLKAGGVDVTKQAAHMVAVTDLWFPSKDDKNYGVLAHPREHDPIDEEMVADMLARFRAKKPPIEHDALVWDVGPDPKTKKQRLLVINGCRRDKHGIEAQKRLHASGELPKGEVLRIGIVFWKPPKDASDADAKAYAIAERRKQNVDPLRKPDSARVLADQAAALGILGKNAKDIAALLGVTPREADALLSFDNLHPEARAAFDAGAPVGLLPAVLAAPREEHAAKVAAFQAQGVTTQKGVSRAEGREARKAEGKASQKLSTKLVVKADKYLSDVAASEESKPEDERDYSVFWVLMGARFVNGDEEARTQILKALPEDKRQGFLRAVGLDKSTGRPRGRPRKNTAPAAEPAEATATDEDDNKPDMADGPVSGV